MLLSALFLNTSCEKVVADDISEETPVLILPIANDTLASNEVHFKWEPLDGASKYRLQIVSPSFAAIETYVLDSVITTTDFFMALDSNAYELKLTALNGGYQSLTYGPVPFWVGVQGAVSGGNVVLSTPSDNGYVNASFTNKFIWNSLSSANSYEFSLREGTDFISGTPLDFQNNISTTSYTTGVSLTEGDYSWGVKAFLTSGGETSNTIRTLHVDLTDPNVAGLVSPTNLTFLNAGAIDFNWTNGTDPGTVHSPVSSHIIIASDATFTTIKDEANVIGNSFTSTLTSGVYYWKVTNSDGAGNIAAESEIMTITVN